MITLEEGKEYPFYVEKLLALPDGDYFILIDEVSRKYLLPRQYYTDYPIKVGTTIICNVNKINCNGKIFLEPLHPIYKVGDEDVFTLTAIEQRVKHRTQEPYFVIKAHNAKTNKAAAITFSNIDTNLLPVKALCKIVKIKKAELLLDVLNIV